MNSFLKQHYGTIIDSAVVVIVASLVLQQRFPGGGVIWSSAMVVSTVVALVAYFRKRWIERRETGDGINSSIAEDDVASEANDASCMVPAVKGSEGQYFVYSDKLALSSDAELTLDRESRSIETVWTETITVFASAGTDTEARIRTRRIAELIKEVSEQAEAQRYSFYLDSSGGLEIIPVSKSRRRRRTITEPILTVEETVH